MRQLPLFPDAGRRAYTATFPSTRYQGSKRKLTDWIWANVCNLQFETVLDVFGGTGAVSHLFKSAGKEVIYNDYLVFNWNIGRALIENSSVALTPDNVERMLKLHPAVVYPDFIQKTFDGIYFTDEENCWLDQVVYNIAHFLDDPFKQALARFALCQACIIKRPYNLFHRANLYMRHADVDRSFGNKVTWDTPFETHFRAFVEEANEAVFDNHRTNRALNLDALDAPTGADLVYLDPPYLNEKGVGVDYRDFYHFLEGMVGYGDWAARIDYRSKHRRLLPERSAWSYPSSNLRAFEALIARHRESILVISYRDNGMPSARDLMDLLSKYKANVSVMTLPQKYVLSISDSHELLLVGT